MIFQNIKYAEKWIKSMNNSYSDCGSTSCCHNGNVFTIIDDKVILNSFDIKESRVIYDTYEVVGMIDPAATYEMMIKSVNFDKRLSFEESITKEENEILYLDWEIDV